MSGPERHPPDDRLLQEFLDGQGEVTRAYRASVRPAAPPELEPAVLQIARDALGRPVIRQRRSPWLQRWRLPLAAAASLVLSLGVLLNLQQDRELHGQAFDMVAMPPAPAPQVQESPRLEAEAVQAAPAPAVPAESLHAAAVPSAKPRAAREAAARQDRRAKLERRVEPSRSSAAAMAAASPPPEHMAQEADADAVMMATSPDPVVQAAPESTMADAMADTPQEAVASTAAPAPPAAAKSARMAPAFAAAAMEAPAPPPLPSPREMEPAAWLQRIVELRDRPDLEAARRELAEFRKVYPQYPLPEDLKPLLP